MTGFLTVRVISSCSAFGGVDGQAILKSISYDNLPHPDFYARLKFHVIRPFPLDTSFLGLQFTLGKCNVSPYFRFTNRRACTITLSASLASSSPVHNSPAIGLDIETSHLECMCASVPSICT